MTDITDMSKNNPAWELIGDTIPGEDMGGGTWRMKVPGGWLVRVAEYIQSNKKDYSYKIVQALTFVSDPCQTWVLPPPKPPRAVSGG